MGETKQTTIANQLITISRDPEYQIWKVSSSVVWCDNCPSQAFAKRKRGNPSFSHLISTQNLSSLLFPPSTGSTLYAHPAWNHRWYELVDHLESLFQPIIPPPSGKLDDHRTSSGPADPLAHRIGGALLPPTMTHTE